jgi:thioredoxin 1
MNPRLVLIALLPLLATPSCDKARALAAKARGTSASPTETPETAARAGAPDVRELDPIEFDSFIATPGRLMVVDFHADWCGPCKVLGPVLEQVAGEFSNKVSVGKINVDHAGELAAREKVAGIPDVRLYRDGKRVAGFIGAVDAARIRLLFREHGAGLGSAPPPTESAAGAPVAPIQPMRKDWLPPGMERR